MNMKTFLVVALALLILCATGGILFRVNSPARAQSSSDSGEANTMTDDFIDQKARRAKGNDEPAVRKLADEVFATPYFAEIPSDYREAMKERVVRDELKYRNGKKGIGEEKVVLTVNHLARKFNAPDFAKTSPAQVRALRVRLKLGYPNFIAQETREGKKGLKKKAGDTINPEMSPLEAAFVTGVLVQQKMLNADFQYEPQVWDEKLRKGQLKQWEAGANPGAQNESRLVQSKGNAKRNEMRRAVTQSASKMSVTELMSLPDETLDTLGIER
jgi:hypothetical protein